MTWEDGLYQIVKEQAYWSILRYDPRRADKMQELISQCFVKYQRDVAAGKEIRKQDYKNFVSKRAREVDLRSVCLKGKGGTSSLDALSFVNRRSTAPITVVEYSDWMAVTPKSKEIVEANLCFAIDYSDWLKTLNKTQRRIFELLIEGYKCSKIAQMIHSTSVKVKQIIMELRRRFVEFFEITVQCA
jgi:DNA-directed RNA polymerase specialized sigma24 family protein